MDKRKTGIALFITLMVIASIMSIMAVSFSYLEKVQKDAGATSALIQANILHGDVINVLKRYFPAGSNNNDKLALIYDTPIPLNEEKSGFLLYITCSPLMIASPINWLDPEQTRTMPEKSTLANKVLEHVMELYELESPNNLHEMLLEAINGKSLQNNDYEPRIQKGKGIISPQQFDKILLNYAMKYDDTKALAVPWNKYFTFLEVNEQTKIDGNYLSAEFMSAAFEMPIEIVLDSWIKGESTLSTFLSENGITASINNKIYANQALNAMTCKQLFVYKEQEYKFKFNYTEGRSRNFEFNGQK